MTDKKDEAGKGGARPGEAGGAKRPYATIDLEATEVESKAAAPAPGGTARIAADAPSGAKPEVKATQPPPRASGQAAAANPGPSQATSPGRMQAAQAWLRGVSRNDSFLSHVAAGVAGALLVLIFAAMFGPLSLGEQDSQRLPLEYMQRLTSLEQALRQRGNATGDVAGKLASAESRLAALEEKAKAIGALSDAQAKLAGDTKSLEVRVGSEDLTGRIAKLETAMAAVATGEQSGRSAQASALSAKLAEIERATGEAGEAVRSGMARADRDLAVLRTEATRLGQRIDTLRGDIEERLKGAAKAAEIAPLAAKLAAVEADLQAFLRNDAERSANTSRVVLALELANLKRALDRGERYASELAAARRVAGETIDLAPLDRHALDGVPTQAELARNFRRIANAALDAEAQPADAGVLERLLAGARGIVRVRKAGHSADDASAEAIVSRMESALKDGRLAEVLAQGKKLPARAALAAEDWLKKVEARQSADAALADVEAQLKTSLGAGRTGPEPRR
jgi:hypothetical protein